MNIEVGKWYKTCKGEKAYVACEMPGPVKFCGYRIRGDVGIPSSWHADGSYIMGGSCTEDLCAEWSDKPDIDWSREKDWVKAIAMMSCIGYWYRFSEEPVYKDNCWWTKEGGYLMHKSEYPKWSGDWKDSLVIRPKGV
jgi:hypothetical protein